MILELLGKHYQYNNEPGQIALLLQVIEEQAANENLYVEGYVVDNLEVIEPLDSYLTEHIQTVNRIEVKLIDKAQLCLSLITEGKDYIGRALPAIDVLADLYYQSPDKEAWSRLEQLIEALAWFNQVIEVLAGYYTGRQRLQDQRELLQNTIVQLHEAIHNNDSVLIADTMVHELIPAFEELSLSLLSLENGGEL
jgi:hypothetical protein